MLSRLTVVKARGRDFLVLAKRSAASGDENVGNLVENVGNLAPRGPFCHALEIGTRGQVQRHSGFEWLCKHNRLRPEPIRFVRLDSGHAQSDGKSVNRRLQVLHLARDRDPRLLTKRIVASENEIDQWATMWAENAQFGNCWC